jgi:hypothetical protein
VFLEQGRFSFEAQTYSSREEMGKMLHKQPIWLYQHAYLWSNGIYL